MWRCALLGLLALVVVLVIPQPAAASELSWQGPPECAAGEPLRFAVERALGRPRERASRLDFEVRAEVSSSVASARLRVVTPASAVGAEPADDAAVAKERVFVAPDCSKLVDTLAVAIALAIASSAPVASESEPGAAGSPNIALPSPAEPPPVATTPRAPDELDPIDGDDGVRPSVLFALVGDSGSLPSPAVGASLGLELGVGPIAVRALGTLLFEQRVHLASPDGDAAADLRSTFGTLQACANALTATSSLSLPICAGVDAGLLSGSGVSISRPQRASAAWVAPRADAGLLWDIPSTRLRLDVLITAAAPLIRDEFVVQGIGAVHRASRVVGRAAMGLALRF
jgi:hypothetical protein